MSREEEGKYYIEETLRRKKCPSCGGVYPAYLKHCPNCKSKK